MSTDDLLKGRLLSGVFFGLQLITSAELEMKWNGYFTLVSFFSLFEGIDTHSYIKKKKKVVWAQDYITSLFR